MRVRKQSVFPILLAFLLLGTCACDNTIQPYSDRATYSVWGYLSISRSLQVVRVKDLSRPLNTDSSDLPDLSVTLEDRSTETTYSLRDTVIYFEDEGTRVATQNFLTERSLKPETEYRITVEDSAGTTVHATTTTPSTSPPVAVQDTGNCLTTFTIKFPGIDRKGRLEINTQFVVNGERAGLSAVETPSIRLGNPNRSPNHDDVFLSFKPESLLEQRLGETVDDLFTNCTYESLCPALSSPTEETDSVDTPGPSVETPSRHKEVTISYTVLGPDWYDTAPDGSTPTNPLETASVSNGRGRLGSVYRNQVHVKVDTTRDICLETSAPFCAPCGEDEPSAPRSEVY